MGKSKSLQKIKVFYWESGRTEGKVEDLGSKKRVTTTEETELRKETQNANTSPLFLEECEDKHKQMNFTRAVQNGIWAVANYPIIAGEKENIYM